MDVPWSSPLNILNIFLVVLGSYGGGKGVAHCEYCKSDQVAIQPPIFFLNLSQEPAEQNRYKFMAAIAC